MEPKILPKVSPYTDAAFEDIKPHVLIFMQQQPGYSGKALNIQWPPQDGGVYIQYGNNLQSGIAGFGETTEAAFADFLREWTSVNGEEHIKKYASGYKNSYQYNK